MVYFPFLGSTLLRTQRTFLQRTFCRSKSITAAIERGRQSRSDHAPRPRTRSRIDSAKDEIVKTRREKRLERFGPPRPDSDAITKSQDGGLRRNGQERIKTRQVSRFNHASDTKPYNGFRERKESRPFSGRAASLQQSRDERRPRAFKRDRKSPLDHVHAGERAPYSGRGEARDRLNVPFQERSRSTSERYKAASDANERLSDRRHTTGSRGSERYSGGSQSSSSTRFRSDDPRDCRDNARARSGESAPGRDHLYHSSRGQAGTPVEPRSYADTLQTSIGGPESLPYTTAASEFMYGYSSVLAAVKANRRKLYNLYIHSRGSHRDGLMACVRAQKLFSITNEVGEEYLRVMDKVSSGRPHNGIVLEASALPVPPITELKTASIEDESFSVGIDNQSAEDLAVNGKQELYSYKSGGWRHPLVLYVDGVLDEGNLGAIARSAYFLGVDAIITPTRQTAPWSHIALKASAGAAEAIPVFKVGDSTDFLGKSSRAGWRIYASDAVSLRPSSAPISKLGEDNIAKVVYSFARSTKRLPADHSPVSEHPTILMMGGEGTGLRNSLQNLAHYKVGIPHSRNADDFGVDSLNVSVAASLLCYEMLQKPKARPGSNSKDALF